MSLLQRFGKVAITLFLFAIAATLALTLHGSGGLWEGLTPAIAANNLAVAQSKDAYDLTQLRVVNEVLRYVRDRYVDPKRVKPKEMLLSALNFVQRDVAQVIVLYEDGAPTVKVRVDTQEREFHVDNVQGPWDIAARLREVFAFVQDGLRGTDVDLRDVEYAACNGMLHTLDPHSLLLSPDAYKEMNLTTSGQFGGLGIVISIRDQQLTVINPMPGTPAGRAGLKKNDRIQRINGESTLNMGLTEAVNHLRGEKGSKVVVYIHRDGEGGWQGAKPFELTREVIHVESVTHKLLDGNIGYVRIKQFQANTSSELDAALLDMKKNGELKGLVLDLRGNPGGLLDQAARVADKFIADGPIVATVGNPSEGREEKDAHVDGTEPNYPIALLVSGTSASASEIVAGAMKNHDRAVIMGETTFGKGSVQLIFNELPDKAALKLTIAQYLTEPGDISIQGTGVTPDIELDPMTVDTQEMDLVGDDGALIKERDLARSLSNARIREGQRPLETVRYDLPSKDRQDLRERGGDPDDAITPESIQKDFPIRFARDVVAHVPSGKRLDQVHAAKATIAEARSAELAKVTSELKTLGFDWSDAPGDPPATAPTPTPPAGVDVKLETDKTDNTVTAGDQMTMKVTVTNKGTTPLFRLYGVTKSDNPLFDAKELVIGRLDPGKSKTAMVPFGWCDVEGHKAGSTAPVAKDAPRVCRIPKDTLTRADGLKVHFSEARGHAPADAETRATVKGLERPVFAYTYTIADDIKGNGDGRVQKGESLTMYLTVKNTGKGPSFETQANLKNLSGDGLLLHEGRFYINNMAPGETRRVAFTFDVTQDLADPEAKADLSIADADLRESVVEKVRMPIAAPLAIDAASGTVHAKANGADLLESPEPGSRSFGRLAANTAAPILGKYASYTKIGLAKGRFAFVANSDVDSGGSPAATVAFDDTMSHAPPAIELGAPALDTRDTHTTIKGTASDGERLLDGYIFVGSRKVFYHSNRDGADPKKMNFEADLPLRPGVNIVSVVARENPDTTSRKTFVVRRDGPNGEILATPKTDDELGDTGGGDDD
jgi:carboxyl-terminal processing protease